MKTLIRLLVFISIFVMLTASSTWAEVTIPFTFTPETKAKADEVNDNFTAVKDAVDAINSNLGDPLTNAVNMDLYWPTDGIFRIYEVTKAVAAIPTTQDVDVTWTVTPGGFGERVEERVFEDNSVEKYFLGELRHGTTEKAQGLELWMKETVDTTGTITTFLLYEPSLQSIYISGYKILGLSWGGGSRVTNSPPPVTESFAAATYTLVNIEDVTVTAGTFADCAKIVSWSQIPDPFMVGMFSLKFEVWWIAEGIGVVKYISFGESWDLKIYSIPPSP